MKQTALHIYVLIAAFLFHVSPARMAAEGIRIIPRSTIISGDSLRIILDLDLNSVRVGNLTAIYFTPYLDNKGQLLSLPPVVITGSKRARFERREQTLLPGNAKRIEPYLILCDTRKAVSKKVEYRIAIPYAAWMQHASLLLSQQIKDCCDLRTLSLDTLTTDLALNDPCGEQTAVPEKINEKQGQRTIEERKTALAKTATVKGASGTSPVIQSYSLSLPTLAFYIPMVSFLKPDLKEIRKRRKQSVTLYIDYPFAKYEVYPNFRNNREEIDKIDRILRPLLSDGYSDIEQINIRGYASPEGDYGTNETLSSNRSHFFMEYVKKTYGVAHVPFNVSSVAEDWSGLAELLEKDKPSYGEAALRIINRYGIFEGREKYLQELENGLPYRDMLKRLYPKLRRIEVTVRYQIRKVEPEDACELIYTNPSLLSLEEMYAVARYYRPGTDQYREVYEVAAYHYPDDVIANVNAASAVLLTGDLKSAHSYLRKVREDPRAWNNIGILCLMEGDKISAAEWFRKAVGVEPQKARMNLQIAEEGNEALRIENGE